MSVNNMGNWHWPDEIDNNSNPCIKRLEMKNKHSNKKLTQIAYLKKDVSQLFGEIQAQIDVDMGIFTILLALTGILCKEDERLRNAVIEVLSIFKQDNPSPDETQPFNMTVEMFSEALINQEDAHFPSWFKGIIDGGKLN